jgi:hypothetical protein
MAVPVETKVKASTAAAAVSGIALWLIGRYVFRGAAVPDVLQSWIYTLAPAVVTFGAGYIAKHTSRSAAPPVITVNVPAGAGADVGRQVAAAVKAYEGRRGTFVQPEVGLPPDYDPPSAALTPPPEKTLQPPAALE